MVNCSVVRRGSTCSDTGQHIVLDEELKQFFSGDLLSPSLAGTQATQGARASLSSSPGRARSSAQHPIQHRTLSHESHYPAPRHHQTPSEKGAP